MTTPRDIITLAMKDCGAFGVGQTPLAEDVSDAFIRLNMMLAQWTRKRWLVYQLVDLHVVSTGATHYTIGSQADILITNRPDRLEDAYLRLLSPVPTDTPLTVLQSREDYDKVALKSLVAVTTNVFYDPAWPVGVIYPTPAPPAGTYELHVIVKAVLEPFISLDQTVDLPSEYMAALHYNLTLRLGPGYGIPPNPIVQGLAADALDVVRGASAAIATLGMPPLLLSNGGFNVYTGRG